MTAEGRSQDTVDGAAATTALLRKWLLLQGGPGACKPSRQLQTAVAIG